MKHLTSGINFPEVNNKVKQSQTTGRHIFDTITGCKNEIRELDEAMQAVSDELGRDNLAYTLLDKQRRERNQELTKLLNTIYVVKPEQTIESTI